MRAALGAAALCVLTLAGAAAAQTGPTDPREAEDPRSATSDPRSATDPRDAAAIARAAGETEALFGIPRFEALWSGGERAALVTAFGEEPWDVLPYLDGIAEAWLAQRESGPAPASGSQAGAVDLKLKLADLAALADQALGDSDFSGWSARLLAWTDDELRAYRGAQASFVEARALYERAGSAAQSRAALTPLNRALTGLRPLGATWETTLALALVARIQIANGELEPARLTCEDLLRLGRSLRDLDAVWNALGVRYQGALADRDYAGAQDLLREQYRISLEIGDEARAQQVAGRLAGLLEFRDDTGR